MKDGHIYYGNNVIKIRYDQIEKQDGNSLTNESCFDLYSELFDLPGKSIQSVCPYDSRQAHKLAYLINDNKMIDPKQIMIVPYLHDRKIYL